MKDNHSKGKGITDFMALENEKSEINRSRVR